MVLTQINEFSGKLGRGLSWGQTIRVLPLDMWFKICKW